jgi:hypothetical protein
MSVKTCLRLGDGSYVGAMVGFHTNVVILWS